MTIKTFAEKIFAKVFVSVIIHRTLVYMLPPKRTENGCESFVLPLSKYEQQDGTEERDARMPEIVLTSMQHKLFCRWLRCGFLSLFPLLLSSLSGKPWIAAATLQNWHFCWESPLTGGLRQRGLEYCSQEFSFLEGGVRRDASFMSTFSVNLCVMPHNRESTLSYRETSDGYAFFLDLTQSLLQDGAVSFFIWILKISLMGFSLSLRASCARILNMIRF